uniref:VPS28 N-terminal domain-containing protein n=1 Tax=Euplotes harpa TaxID=151035 RepID=A0A7S3N8M1_9SPIT|mmetsp:Transcript_23677/g.27221  ORF Transcript_23677/g.27221 Transcript_23677/m.27221 type:complete len:200 (+) Transcript_23677:16-615(+)
MNSALKLTTQEKAELEDLQNIYSIIRTLDALEAEHARGRVKEDEYQELCTRYITQFEQTMENMENFLSLDTFASMYNLTQCKNAIKRLKEKSPMYTGGKIGKNQAVNAFRLGTLIVNLTDYIDLDEVSVEEILPKMRDIQKLMQATPSIAREDKVVSTIDGWVEKLESKKSIDSLDKEESTQLKIDLDSLRSSVENSMI